MAALRAKLSSRVSSSIGSPGGTIMRKDMITKWHEHLKVATWNVKTMNQAGKINNTIQENEDSEMRWPNARDIVVDKYRVFYSGRLDGIHEHGVGVILSEEAGRCVKSFIPISSRVLLLQLNASPININILQVYSPTADKTDEEVADFYNSTRVD